MRRDAENAMDVDSVSAEIRELTGNIVGTGNRALIYSKIQPILHTSDFN